ncbi:MAG TPA: stage II sporulation protein M [Candidatus Norongarragalinales archaeon]|nr:stage II sporulation protein M [Candidatus Norongarragalinales archaeon]
MVLEFWFERKTAMPDAWQIVLQSFLFVSLAVGATVLLGLQQSNLAFLFFVSLPSIPFLLKVFQSEVEEEEKPDRRKFLGSKTLARHFTALKVLAAYFFGLVIAFTFFYLILPPDYSNALFSMQKAELQNIRGSFQGYAINAVAATDAFELIFTHNLQVLLFVVIFSLIYGAGAVLILVWNASVIGVFLGDFSNAYILSGGAGLSGFTGGHITGVSLGLLGILPHGVFELLSYLTAALAGGVLSAAVIRGDFNKPFFTQIVYDIAKLLGWAILFLAIGAFIETYPALLA